LVLESVYTYFCTARAKALTYVNENKIEFSKKFLLIVYTFVKFINHFRIWLNYIIKG
jgi:hypothetical protein